MKESPFDTDGNLKPDAFKNLVVAMLLRSGGSIELTFAQLEASNKRQFQYYTTEQGLRVDLIDQHEAHA